MKVKVSKVMANKIAKAMRKLGVGFEEISCIKMSEREFVLNVGDPYIKAGDCDYDWNDEKYRVIRIVYPYDYYAMPNYLTTRDLERCFERSSKTLDSFMQQIKERIEV